MRMAGPDVVLFIVGALLFGGALTAIIVTQGPGAFSGTAGGAGAFTVSWPTTTKDLAKVQVADFSAASASFKVDQTNVGNVTVKVNCQDSPVGGAASFALTVKVEGPSGIAPVTKNANCGDRIEIPVHVQNAPPATAVANSDDVPAASTVGQGDWKVTVSGQRPAPGGVGLPLPGQTNPGGDIGLTVETFAAKVESIGK